MTDSSSPYQQLAKLIGAPASKILPRIIEHIADQQEIEIVLAAFPAATVPEISVKTGIAAGKVEEMAKVLFKKGMLFLSRKEGELRYYRIKTVAQFHDSSILWEGATPEFHRLWKEYTAHEWAEFGRAVEVFLPKPVIRIVPVGATIESKAKVLPLEDVREIVDQAEKKAAKSSGGG